MFFLPLLVTLAAAPAPSEWTVDGVKREAIVVAPTKASSSPPLLFVFHGHGGTAKHAHDKYAFHTHWPDAVVVYPQGLNTPGKLTDPEGKKSGWQSAAGEQGDRDLKFYDAVRKDLLAKHKCDAKRVYSTGHSNGGGFSYTLWAAPGDTLAAVAPSAAGPGPEFRKLTPKPVLHVMGETDPLVKPEWQKATIEKLKTLNETAKTPKPVDAGKLPAGAKVEEFPSAKGFPVRTYVHPGDHTFPTAAVPVIVEFLKGHAGK